MAIENDIRRIPRLQGWDDEKVYFIDEKDKEYCIHDNEEVYNILLKTCIKLFQGEKVEMINSSEPLESVHKADSRALHRLSAQIVELLGENAKIQREAKRLHHENHALRAILMAMRKDAIGILNEADLE